MLTVSSSSPLPLLWSSARCILLALPLFSRAKHRMPTDPHPEAFIDTVSGSIPVDAIGVAGLNVRDLNGAWHYLEIPDAHICADVDVVVDTYYDGYHTIPTACEAMVLLADDTDLTALQHAAEQWELAEDVSLWDYVDPTPNY